MENSNCSVCSKDNILINAAGLCPSCAFNESEKKLLENYKSPERLSDDQIKIAFMRINNLARGEEKRAQHNSYFDQKRKLIDALSASEEDSKERESIIERMHELNFIMDYRLQIDHLLLVVQELVERIEDLKK